MPTRSRWRSAHVPVAVYVAVLLLLPAALVVTAMDTGWWTRRGATIAAAAGTEGVPGADGGSGAGTSTAAVASPADVKGSMTVRQVADAFPQVTPARILARLHAPAGTPVSTQLKTLAETGDGTDIPTFREWLQTELTATP